MISIEGAQNVTGMALSNVRCQVERASLTPMREVADIHEVSYTLIST